MIKISPEDYDIILEALELLEENTEMLLKVKHSKRREQKLKDIDSIIRNLYVQ
jgi:hypothetical protein